MWKNTFLFTDIIYNCIRNQFICTYIVDHLTRTTRSFIWRRINVAMLAVKLFLSPLLPSPCPPPPPPCLLSWPHCSLSLAAAPPLTLSRSLPQERARSPWKFSSVSTLIASSSLAVWVVVGWVGGWWASVGWMESGEATRATHFVGVSVRPSVRVPVCQCV